MDGWRVQLHYLRGLCVNPDWLLDWSFINPFQEIKIKMVAAASTTTTRQHQFHTNIYYVDEFIQVKLTLCIKKNLTAAGKNAFLKPKTPRMCSGCAGLAHTALNLSNPSQMGIIRKFRFDLIPISTHFFIFLQHRLWNLLVVWYSYTYSTLKTLWVYITLKRVVYIITV